MGILDHFRLLFRKATPVLPPTDVLPGNSDLAVIARKITEYETRHLAEVAAESKGFSARYGKFTAFLYRPDFDHFVRGDVLPFRQPNSSYNHFLDNNHWPERHPWNFPGAFYTGESDTCGTGICEAPANVLNDEHACEFVFRQPTDFQELLCVLDAAATEVLSSYSANGHQCWTYQECQQWWRNRHSIISELGNPDVINANGGKAHLYRDYLQGDAESDLRRYCYFLENGVYPEPTRAVLPAL